MSAPTLFDHILNQLAENSTTDETGEHLVMLDSAKKLHVSGLKYTSAQRASAYLHMGEWVDAASPGCGMSTCVRPDHMTVVLRPAPTADADDLGLVQRHSMSLSSLYKKAKSRGLLPPRSEYGHAV